MTEEGKVKVKIDRWIKDNMPDADIYKSPGGAFGNNGAPDYFITYLATPIKIEVKREGGVPTKLQMHKLQLHKKAGGISALIAGFDVGKLQLIKSMCEERYNLIRMVV